MLDILGRTLYIKNAPPQLSQWLEERWLFEPYKGVLNSSFRLNLEYLKHPTKWPQLEPRLLQVMETLFEVRQGGTEQWLGPGEWGVYYNTQTLQLEVWGEFGPSAQVALFAALFDLVASTGLVYMHAAVAAWQGQASLFLGPSGRGKTSTLRRALQAGWGLVAEDVVWLEPHSLKVFGWDKGVRILPHDLAAWQQTWPHLQPGELVRDKYFFSYAELGLKVQPAHLGQVVLLQRDAGHPTAWLPAEPRETIMGLWQATGIPLSLASRSFVQTTLPQLASRVQQQRLILGQGEPF